jgi:DNA topoisomerase-1
MEMETTTQEDALRLLRLPRTVGEDADGESVLADYGRYGPYIKRGVDTRSLEKPEDVFDVTLEKALARLAEAPTRGRRRASKVMRELGVDPTNDLQVKVMHGPYGLYVTDGSINASLAKDAEVEKVTLEEAIDLIRVREATGKVRRKKKTKKKAKKKTTKKATKKVTKSAKPGAKKKSAPKKKAPKKSS